MSDEIAKLPGLKESALARLGPCAVCRRPLSDREKGGLTFYKVALTRGVLLPRAIERRAALQMFLGGGAVGAALALAMGPDEDLAKIVGGTTEVMVHEGCAGDVRHLLLLIPEKRDAPVDEEERIEALCQGKMAEDGP